MASGQRLQRVISGLALAAGTALAVTVPLVTTTSDRVHAFHAGAVQRLAHTAPASTAAPPTVAPGTAPAGVPDPGTAPSATQDAPAIPTVTGTPAPTPSPALDPVRVQLPSLGVAAAVVDVGLDRAGGVAVPADVRTVGWYRWSQPPGATEGATVLVGHVDSAAQGRGALFRLRQVTGGAFIQVRTAGGAELGYRVVSVAEFAKTRLPLADIFSSAGTPRLVLLTCGGRFDETTRSYEDNIVVTAVPA